LVPRDGAIIFSDLVGKLDVLRVACEKCDAAARADETIHPIAALAVTFLTSDAQHTELAGEVAEYDGTVVGFIEFRNRPVKLASTGY
jgi:hypothetical protein